MTEINKTDMGIHCMTKYPAEEGSTTKNTQTMSVHCKKMNKIDFFTRLMCFYAFFEQK